MLAEISIGLEQKFSRQTLERVPEPSLVMVTEEQDKEYNRAAFLSALNISYELIINSLLKRSPLSGRALDICCASGQLLLSVAREMPGMHFTAIDLSDEMLALAEKNRAQWNVSNVEFKKGDMLKLDVFPEKSFDLVTCNNALHHCPTPEDVVTLLNGISRVVKDTGTVFIFDLLRVKTEKLLVKLLNHTAQGFGDHFYNDTYDSYGAAFTYSELSTLAKRSRLKNFRHVRPAFLDVIQILYVSKTHNPVMRLAASRLINLKQKIDYGLLSLLLAGKI